MRAYTAQPLGRRLCLVLALLVPFSAWAQPARAQPAPPALEAPVNDFAGVIDAGSAAELERRIRALQTATGDTVVVATVPTFQPYGDIREYAGRMFQNGGRGIGEKGKENGLLILVAVQDRRVNIEVGYALEEFITDGFAGETIRDVITPQFRTGNYGGGLLAGATRIINRIAERRGVNLQDVPADAPPPMAGSPRLPVGMILFWIVLALLFSRRGRRRRGRHWGGGPWSGWSSGIGPFAGGGGFGGGFGGFGGGGGLGGGGGGFGGFGGGRSGGGGASGGW